MPKSLSWWTPRWSRRRDCAKVAPTVFGSGPLLRIAAVSVLAGAGVCLVAKWLVPALPIGVIALRALAAIPAMLAFVGLQLLLLLFVPGSVKLTETFVLHSTGTSGWRANWDRVEAARLVVYSEDLLRLHLRVKGRWRRIAVPPDVDLRVLRTFLPQPEVLDRRAAFVAARRLVDATKCERLGAATAGSSATDARNDSLRG